MSLGIPATLGEAAAARWRIARLLPRAGWWPVTATAGCDLALGVLPVAFIISTSVMLGRVPAAVRAGPDSAEWTAVVVAFGLAAATFAAQQALVPLQVALGELIARRVDGEVGDELMAAALASPGIGPLEDQRLRDDLGQASRELEHAAQSPGKACAGMLHLIARVAQLAGYVLVLAVAFSWLAAVGVLAVVMMFRHGQRGGLRRYSRVFRSVTALWREHDYLRTLATGAPAAKEIRVFGLVDWIRQRARRAYLAYLAPVWRERRRILLRPYFWYAGAGLLVTAVVLAAVGAAGAGTAQLTSLALVIQAVLGALRLGEFYPEADVQTQFGMNAYDAVRRFQDGVRSHGAGDAAPDTTAARARGLAPALGAASGPAAPAPVPRVEIRFRDVTFAYPGQRRPVFDRLSLTVPAGQCTAVVGMNGAGKTTLVKLLARLYEPQHGRITVDSTDLRALPVAAWRDRVAVIFQDFNRYEASAADNIGLGAAGHRDDRAGIRAAAAAAGVLEDLAALPAGLDTPLARHVPGGVDLSGGQWQRVALARALFRLRHGGAVLVLDEPTASLDVRSEARFFDEFVRLTRGRTTLLISHRFATVRRADRVVVLAGGRVEEQGSHEELVRAGGRYARLFRIQADRFTAGDIPAGDTPAGDRVPSDPVAPA